jgi:hypothetical protein
MKIETEGFTIKIIVVVINTITVVVIQTRIRCSSTYKHSSLLYHSKKFYNEVCRCWIEYEDRN